MREPEEIVVEEREEVVERVAAVDVAKASGKVCTRVPHPSVAGRRVTKVWDVSSRTGSIMELGDELAAQGIERVVVESTSDYWRPFVYLLEARGLDVWLVNARDVKNVPGRPKTDKLDAIWLAKLAERQMLRPSFVPPVAIRQLRDYTRLRVDLVEERTRYKQRVEKLLEDSLIKLSSVASDIFGKSGRAMLAALIAGERDPNVLAELALGQMRKKTVALRQALTGRFDEHHAELMSMLLEQVDALDRKIETLTARATELIAEIPAAAAAPARPGIAATAAPLCAVERLDEITGIGVVAAQAIIAEVGLKHGTVPDRRTSRLLGEDFAADYPVRSQEPIGPHRQRQSLSEAGPRRGSRRRVTHRHLPRRALPSHRQAPGQAEGDRGGLPLDPCHRLAPSRRPHGPLSRSRP
jgi:transposase